MVTRHLAQRWMSLHELGRTLGVDQRTMRRAVYVLRAGGVDILHRRRADSLIVEYRLNRASWLAALDLPED
jgi:biotin operon repressor